MPNVVVHSSQCWLNPWIKDCGPFSNTLISSQFFFTGFYYVFCIRLSMKMRSLIQPTVNYFLRTSVSASVPGCRDGDVNTTPDSLLFMAWSFEAQNVKLHRLTTLLVPLFTTLLKQISNVTVWEKNAATAERNIPLHDPPWHVSN